MEGYWNSEVEFFFPIREPTYCPFTLSLDQLGNWSVELEGVSLISEPRAGDVVPATQVPAV